MNISKDTKSQVNGQIFTAIALAVAGLLVAQAKQNTQITANPTSRVITAVPSAMPDALHQTS